MYFKSKSVKLLMLIHVCFLQELKRVNHDLETQVNELTSTCMMQKDELSRLANEESGSEVNTYLFLTASNSSNLFAIKLYMLAW